MSIISRNTRANAQDALFRVYSSVIDRYLDSQDATLEDYQQDWLSRLNELLSRYKILREQYERIHDQCVELATFFKEQLRAQNPANGFYNINPADLNVTNAYDTLNNMEKFLVEKKKRSSPEAIEFIEKATQMKEELSMLITTCSTEAELRQIYAELRKLSDLFPGKETE